MKFPSDCSDDNLRLLLRDQDDTDEFRLAASHIDTCPQCQSRLAELAAEDGEWCEAREMLVEYRESLVAASDWCAESIADGPDLEWESANDPSNTNPKRERGSPQHRRPAKGQPRRKGPSAWTESMARQLLSPPSHPEMLGRIGRYEVERLIGAGGMGVVFKAFDTELNRPVAVKVLAPYLADSGAARRRFAREARAAAAVVHEHVVAIHNVETDGQAPFLVMQYVAGESLQSRLDREGPLELCEILRIGLQTASGLAAAHAQGLVHRDVKPPNILLESGGVERTLLTDFGLARASDDASLTRTGFHPGTPQYMSPEQARGDVVDARSDLFSLGSVMYAMCTGHSPFRAETTFGILRRITDNEPRPIRETNPDIPLWLERLVGKLQRKSVNERFQTAEEVAELLKRCLAHVQQPTAVDLPAECRVDRDTSIFQTRRHIVATAGIVAVAIALLSVALNRGWFVSTDRQSQVTDSSQVAPAEANPAWDDTADTIRSFDDDLIPFESSLEESWDSIPRLEEE